MLQDDRYLSVTIELSEYQAYISVFLSENAKYRFFERGQAALKKAV